MRPRDVVLPDTSFYIGESRQGRDPLAAFKVLNTHYDVAICGVVCCEFGRGIRHPGQREKFHVAWDLMIDLPTDNRIWREAEEMLWTLGRRGKQIPLGDAIIACSARRMDAVVLTLDRHFREIPNLRVAETVRELILNPPRRT